MSACMPIATAGACWRSAASKIASIQSSAAASRAVYSRERAARSARVSDWGCAVAGSLRSANRSVVVVVGADDVDGAEHHARVVPADVLGERVGLVVDPLRVLAERLAVPREEQPADRAQPLRREKAAVVGAVAVGPLVVARCVDERVFERLEVGEPRPEVGAVTARGAVLDVAEMHDPADVRVRVDLRDVRRELGDLGVAIRDVADHRDRRRRARMLAGRVWTGQRRRSSQNEGGHAGRKKSASHDRRS